MAALRISQMIQPIYLLSLIHHFCGGKIRIAFLVAGGSYQVVVMVEPRSPVSTVRFVDNYCRAFEHLFGDVRSFESFKYLYLELVASLPRKFLPAIVTTKKIRKPDRFSDLRSLITLLRMS